MKQSYHRPVFHIFDCKDSLTWCIWWYSSDGSRKYRATNLKKAEYSPEQAQTLIDEKNDKNIILRDRIIQLLWKIDSTKSLEKIYGEIKNLSEKEEDFIEGERRRISEKGEDDISC